MTSLTIVVHGVSPYLFRTITSKFNSANRNAFLQTLREENPLLDGIVDDSLVFLTSPSINREEDGAEIQLKRCMEFFIAELCSEKMNCKGQIFVNGEPKGMFSGWLPDQTLEQTRSRLLGFCEGSGVNCFVIPITSLHRKRPLDDRDVPISIKRAKWEHDDTPSEQVGFSVKYALSSEIGLRGIRLKLAEDHLQIPSNLPMYRLSKGGTPAIILTSQILVPVDFNHRYVDLVIVSFDKSKKTVLICPVQVSIVTSKTQHADSCKQFYKKDWRMWSTAVKPPRNWKIEWAFLWILDIKRSERTYTWRKRARSHPAYAEWVVNIASISSNVGNALKNIKV